MVSEAITCAPEVPLSAAAQRVLIRDSGEHSKGIERYTLNEDGRCAAVTRHTRSQSCTGGADHERKARIEDAGRRRA